MLEGLDLMVFGLDRFVFAQNEAYHQFWISTTST